MLGHKLYQRLYGILDIFATIRGSFDEVTRFGIFDREGIIENVDLTSEPDIQRAIDISRPDAVINAAGVIKQRPWSKDVFATLTINSILPQRLAGLGQAHGFRTINISTDCVFSGAKGNYLESDPPDSQDLYGISKRLGEITGENCLTLRTSIIGRELETRRSLVEWFLSNRGGNVNGFSRAIYSGFPTIVFADIISNLLMNFPQLSGIYHVSSDPIDKCTLLELLNKAYDANVKIEPDNTFVIDRSLDSSRFRQETLFDPLAWVNMIEIMASDRTPYASFGK